MLLCLNEVKWIVCFKMMEIVMIVLNCIHLKIVFYFKIITLKERGEKSLETYYLAKISLTWFAFL